MKNFGHRLVCRALWRHPVIRSDALVTGHLDVIQTIPISPMGELHAMPEAIFSFTIKPTPALFCHSYFLSNLTICFVFFDLYICGAGSLCVVSSGNTELIQIDHRKEFCSKPEVDVPFIEISILD